MIVETPTLFACKYTHLLNDPFSSTIQVSRYQKGKTNLDFTEARDSEWQWHQLGHMQVCTSLHTDNYGSTPPLSFFTGRMPFLPSNQQRQSTEDNSLRLRTLFTIHASFSTRSCQSIHQTNLLVSDKQVHRKRNRKMLTRFLVRTTSNLM